MRYIEAPLHSLEDEDVISHQGGRLSAISMVLMAIYSAAFLDEPLEAKVDHFSTFYALCGPLHMYLGDSVMLEEIVCWRVDHFITC